MANKEIFQNTQSLSENSRPVFLESIHILRGVSVFLVVCDHIIGRPPYEFVNTHLFWLNNLGIYGVISFFVISGFVLPYSLKKDYNINRYGRFLIRRLIRIQPVYIISIIFSSLIVLVLTSLAPNANTSYVSIGTLIHHFIYFIPFTEDKWILDVYWTLAVEFHFYLIIGLSYPLIRHLCLKSNSFIVIIPILTSLLLVFKTHYTNFQLLHYAPYFSLGIYGALQYFSKSSKLLELLTCLFICIIAAVFHSSIYESIVGLSTYYIIMHWKPSSNNNILIKSLLFLGTISYSWYATHQAFAMVGESFSKLLIKIKLIPMNNILVNIVPLVVFISSIIFAYFIYLYIEKPSQTFSRKLKYKRV